MKNKNSTLSIKDIVLIKQFPEKYLKKQYDEELKSYSHKPHLAELPYDLNTNDPDKLKERLEACENARKDTEQELKDLNAVWNSNEEKIREETEIVENAKTENEELKNQNEKIENGIDDIYERFDSKSREAEADLKDLKEWEDEVMGSYFPSHSAADTNAIRSGLENFYDEIAPKGYLTSDDVDTINDLADLIDNELGGLIDTNYSDAGDEFIGYVGGWTDDLRNYAQTYAINTDSDLDDIDFEEYEDWSDVVEGNNAKMEANDSLISQHQDNLNTLTQDQSSINREIGKTETKIKDYKEQEEKINEKLGEK